jgi:hypothetical protein
VTEGEEADGVGAAGRPGQDEQHGVPVGAPPDWLEMTRPPAVPVVDCALAGGAAPAHGSGGANRGPLLPRRPARSLRRRPGRLTGSARRQSIVPMTIASAPVRASGQGAR